jgi:hypothetical protein
MVREMEPLFMYIHTQLTAAGPGKTPFAHGIVCTYHARGMMWYHPGTRCSFTSRPVSQHFDVACLPCPPDDTAIGRV